jgi:hypothetical protein
MDAPDQVGAYYRRPAVRARIAEYCGGREEDPLGFSSTGLGGYGGRRRLRMPEMAVVPFGNGDFARLLEEGVDVSRSLADRGGTLIQLDLDYVNRLDPGEPYRDPARCFDRLEPVHRAVCAAFERFAVPTFVLMTGRGYHYTARAVRGARLHDDLVSIASVAPPVRARYEAEQAREPLAVSMGQAHDGAGRLLEHLAHVIVRSLRGRTAIPVTIADVPPPGQGPYACLDLTAYGDPLSSRHARCAFSSHQKAWVEGIAPDRPFVLALPRDALDRSELLRARRDPESAARLAADTSVAIPDVTDAPGWVAAYARSALARFHRHFDQTLPAGPEAAAGAYLRLAPGALPSCVTGPLGHPNPALLVPTALRAVALVLWAGGWEARAVSDLVRSRYEADHGWGDLWERYSAAARADFYVRIIIGAVVTGLDDGSDFLCASHQARGACPGGDCGHELGRLFPAGRAARLAAGLTRTVVLAP